MMCAGQLGRPKSESHGGQETESRVVGLNNGTNNPFQDDRLPVWQSANSGNLSSPEVGPASLLVLCSAHRFHNWFSQSRRRPILGPSPG